MTNKISMDKEYVTKAGHEVEILKVLKQETQVYTVFGLVRRDSDWEVECWTSEGKDYGEYNPSGFDLVEKQEYIYLVKSPDGSFFRTHYPEDYLNGEGYEIHKVALSSETLWTGEED